MITLTNIGLQRGSKILLNNTDLRIHPGHKMGIIGANGSGKSTFFKVLSGELAIDQGDIAVPADWRIAYMRQEVSHSDRSAIDFVLDGDHDFRKIQSQISTTENGDKLAHLYSQFEHINGYTAQARAQVLLHGLGFKSNDTQRPVGDFSGGWRIRLNLAQALMCPADLLLLDEPTNHLDLDTTWWLEQRLQQFQGTLLIISHDRDFLDNIVKHIVHIDQQKLNIYNGNYSSFERQKAERLAQQQQLFVKQQEQIAHIEKFIARFRAQATKARQAQSRIKSLERLERIAPAHVTSPFQFEIPCAVKTSNPLLILSQADIGYNDKSILNNVNLRIEPDSRLGLLGPNGAGKSTLIKALVNELELNVGTRVGGEHLRIGYFNQHQLEALDINASPALHIQRLSAKAPEQEIRNYLGGFDFHGDRAFENIKNFSGGEKARLALALVAWQKPNLLLLDEPTNHLDLEMREALTLALQTYAGAVLIISHDRHLLRNSVDEFLLVANGKAEPFDGDLDDYHHWLQNNDLIDDQVISSDTTKETKIDRKQLRQTAAEYRKKMQPLRNKLKKLEANVEKIEKKLSEIETQLSSADLYLEDNKNKLQPLLLHQGELRTELEQCEEEWMLASDEYESLETSISE